LQTRLSHILFFGLYPTKEILWQSPDGVEARKFIIYLQNSAYLPEINTTLADKEGKEGEERHQNIESGISRDNSPGVPERVADLCGDSKSLGVILENGTILSFSWTAKVRNYLTLIILHSVVSCVFFVFSLILLNSTSLVFPSLIAVTMLCISFAQLIPSI